MLLKPFATALIMTIFSCNGIQSQENNQMAPSARVTSTPFYYPEIGSIPPPDGYERKTFADGSFGNWLRNLKLKKNNTVYLYNGTVKPNQSAQFAVLDISVGDRDLQQCADAAMRLRAEYLFEKKAYDQIRFVDNEGGVYRFKAPFSRHNFDSYLARVFGMCGTASLSKQMRTIEAGELKPGDLLLKGGFPGHAVMIVDMAINSSGEKMYLLAQSYMPAQDIHVLVNPNDEKHSPWYSINSEQIIETPEWTFTSSQLKTW